MTTSTAIVTRDKRALALEVNELHYKVYGFFQSLKRLEEYSFDELRTMLTSRAALCGEIRRMEENRSPEQKELLKHIKAINAKTQAWIDEDPLNRGAGLIAEDIEMWEDYGVVDVESFEQYSLVSDVFEATRSFYGFKPNWKELMERSKESLQAELERLHELLEMPF